MSNEFEKNLLFLMVGGDLAEFSGCPFVRTQHSFCHPCRHVREEMQSSWHSGTSISGRELPAPDYRSSVAYLPL